MKIHSEEVISSLKEYRKNGYSIHELMNKFSLPKTTIWHHIHLIRLSKEQREKIRRQQGGSKIRSQKNWERPDKKLF